MIPKILKEICKKACKKSHAKPGFNTETSSQVIYCNKKGTCPYQGQEVKLTLYRDREVDKQYFAFVKPECTAGQKALYEHAANLDDLEYKLKKLR